MKTIEFHPNARTELDQAIAFYEEKSVGLGIDLIDEASSAIDRIREFPTTWPKHGTSRLRKYYLKRFPFVIFYLTTSKKIWIALLVGLVLLIAFPKQMGVIALIIVVAGFAFYSMVTSNDNKREQERNLVNISVSYDTTFCSEEYPLKVTIENAGYKT